jgi:hypothetical protein
MTFQRCLLLPSSRWWYLLAYITLSSCEGHWVKSTVSYGRYIHYLLLYVKCETWHGIIALRMEAARTSDVSTNFYPDYTVKQSWRKSSSPFFLLLFLHSFNNNLSLFKRYVVSNRIVVNQVWNSIDVEEIGCLFYGNVSACTYRDWGKW